MPHQKPTTIAILSGNPLVNRIIDSLLEGLGYKVRLLAEDSEAGSEQIYEGIDLVLLAPTVSKGFQQAFRASMRSTPKTARIPVLTLSTALEEAIADEDGLVPWPCRIEDLTRCIEAALQKVADQTLV